MYSLSFSGRPVAWLDANVSIAGWPVKFQDAPPSPVDRNTYMALEVSGLLVMKPGRMNTWHAM